MAKLTVVAVGIDNDLDNWVQLRDEKGKDHIAKLIKARHYDKLVGLIGQEAEVSLSRHKTPEVLSVKEAGDGS